MKQYPLLLLLTMLCGWAGAVPIAPTGSVSSAQGFVALSSTGFGAVLGMVLGLRSSSALYAPVAKIERSTS